MFIRRYRIVALKLMLHELNQNSTQFRKAVLIRDNMVKIMVKLWYDYDKKTLLWHPLE